MTSRNLRAENTPRQGYTVSIDYEVTERGPRATRVVVEGTDQPVTSTVYHEVKPHELMRRDMRQAPGPQWQKMDPHKVLSLDFPADLPPEHREKAINRAIKDVYEQAAADGTPTAQAVADALGVSIATAGRRIRTSKQHLGWG